MTQLDLFPPKSRRPLSAGKCAARMIAILAVRCRWTTRAEFRRIAGLTDRECRAGCEAANMRIIFGQRGYLPMRDATPEEIRKCRNILCAQRTATTKKLVWLDRRSHGILNGTEVAK